MKKRVLVYIFLLWILFSNVFFNKFKVNGIFQAWDVFIECILVVMVVIKNIKKFNSQYAKYYILYFLILIVGLFGNIIFMYQASIIAVIKDILTFSKFPLTFILLKDLAIDKKLDTYIDNYLYIIIKTIIIVLAICGIVSCIVDIGMSLDEVRFGIHPFTFWFQHPTFLVLTMILILALLEYKSEKIKNVLLYKILTLFIIIITLRTKGIAICVAYVILKVFEKKIKEHKVLAIAVLGISVVAIFIRKVLLYASFSYSTREVLYNGSLKIFLSCFPIGSGFGTFASHISGKYISKVYEFIDVSYVWKSQNISQLGDVGYPYYVGQFGFLGSVFLLILALKIMNLTKFVENKLPVLIILMYIIIALTSESILLNCGTEIAIIMAVVTCINDEKKKEELEH